MRACAIVLAGVLAAAAAQPPADGDPLTRLEDALKADPDNLRAGNDYRVAIARSYCPARTIATR